MSAEIAEVLAAARAVIEKPEAWTKRNYALDADGFATDASVPNAVCFCAIGAIAKTLGLSGSKAHGGFSTGARGALNALERAAGVHDIALFNDDPETAHADVLAAFDLAIEAERATP